jgi:hypothetical protein
VRLVSGISQITERKPEIVGIPQGLLSLLSSVGTDDIRIVNYSFPITELTRRISNRLVKSDHSYDYMTSEQRRIRSAQARPAVINKILSPISGDLFRPFCSVQRWFYHYDLGDGYVATAVKR